MDKVKTKKLSEIADVVDSLHKTPTYSEIGRSMVRVTDVCYGNLNLTNTFKVDEEIFKEFSRRYTPAKGDIVITRVGSYGNTALVYDTNFCLGQNTAAIIPHINHRYLYFALNSKDLKDQIESATVGSTQKTLSLKAINNLNIPRFSETEERVIAKTLGDIDDKITINQQVNQTLEAMAQALFKSWFVDFEPTRAKMIALGSGGSEEDASIAAMTTISGKSDDDLSKLKTTNPEAYAELHATASLFPSRLVDGELGEIPEGWRVSEIGSEIEAVGGGTPSTKEAEFWENGAIHWTTPKDMSNLKEKILIDTEHKITEAGLKKISSGLLPVNTVLMSSRAPVGYLAIAKIPVAINQGYIAMKCNKQLTVEFVIQWCVHNMEDIKQRASGTTFAEISKKSFYPIPVIVPALTVLQSYTKRVINFYSEIEKLAQENKNLAIIRDSLLPKLLAGETSVNNQTDSEE